MRGMVDVAFRGEPLDLLLNKSPKVLIGVGDHTARVLERLGIATVERLATHHVFLALAEIHSLEVGPASDRLRELMGETVEYATLRDLSPESLTFLEKDVRAALRSIFPSLFEMAVWAPFHAARVIFGASERETDVAPATGAGDFESRPGIPDELVPTARRYATSREVVTRNFIDRFGDPSSDTIIDPSPLSTLSLSALREPRNPEPALGAQLVLEYELTPEGIALGRLLHSLTLAPGESTNIAIVTFDRRVGTDAAEQIRQRERLEAETAQSQEFDSETAANVTETQSGNSNVDSTNTAKSTAGAAGVGAALGPVVLGAGVVSTTARNTSNTTVTTSTSGIRNADASASEELLRESQQSAASERERNASLVTEVAENENQRAETRNITNYNHMHTLSVHYYEVVQIHRLEIRTVRAQPLLFVPTELLDFNDIEIVRRYRDALMAVAPDAVTRELIASVEGDRTIERVSAATVTRGIPPESDLEPGTIAMGISGRPLRNQYKMPRTMRFTGLSFRLVDGENLPLMVPKTVVFRLIGGREVRVNVERDLNSFRQWLDVSMPTEIFASEAERIIFELEGSDIRNWGFDFFLNVRNSSGQATGIAFQTSFSGVPQRFTVIELGDEIAFERVVAVLNRDKRRYSEAVYGALGPEELMSFFFGRTFAGVDLGGTIEPRIAAQYGNLIGFPFSFDEDGDTSLSAWWADWKARNYHPENVLRDFIAKPTAGLHAEGILGRANTAEVLDFTRFWNWQDSPIPNLPPKISDVSMASRARVDAAPTPGPLDPAVVNIQNLPGMPDPVGATAALNSVLNSSPFRDMSGVSEAGQTSRAGIAAATTLASETAKAAAGLAGLLANNATELAKTGHTAQSASELAAVYNEQRKNQKPEDADATLRATATPANGLDQTEAANSSRETARKLADTAKTLAEDTKSSDATGGSKQPSKPTPDYGHVLWLSKTPGEQALLLYNFPVGSKEQKLHPQHIEALLAVSAQIEGVADIDRVEGRASGTVTTSGDSARDNENLSIKRMKLVWNELLRLARVPDAQSTAEKQKYLGDTNPVRKAYPQVTAKIPEPTGDEDPAERSVLVVLKKSIKPDIKPEPVPAVPGIETLGHSLVIKDVSGNRNFIQQQIGGWSVSAFNGNTVEDRSVTTGDTFGDFEMTAQNGAVGFLKGGVQLIFNINMAGGTLPAGEKPKAEIDSLPTDTWRIEIHDPKSQGNSPGDLLKDLETAVKELKQLSDTLSPSFSVTLGVPRLGEVTINKDKLFSDIPAMVDFIVGVLNDTIVGNTLRGIRVGRAEARVLVFPVFRNATDSSWQAGVELVLSGNGWQFKAETNGDALTTNVLTRFDYKSAQKFRLREWGSNTGLSQAKLNFTKNDFVAMRTPTVAFLGMVLLEIKKIEVDDNRLNSIKEKAESALEAAIKALTWATDAEKLTFQLLNDNGSLGPEVTLDQVISANIVTAFDIERGILTLRNPPFISLTK